MKDIAKDIVAHFEARQQVFEGKAMIVCMTRNICAMLYNEIIALKPEWHHNDLDKGIKSNYDKLYRRCAHCCNHHTQKQRKDLATRMKDPNDDLKWLLLEICG